MTTIDTRTSRDRDYDDNGDEEVYEPEPLDDEDRPRKSAQESEARRELVQGELAGQTVYCPPVKQWRASAMHALRSGDFDEWAKITLEDDDWEIWKEADPTLQQIEDFFDDINPRLGTGNSRASRRASRSTRRR